MSLAASFFDLFRGSETARGQFSSGPSSGKVKVQGISSTVLESVTIEHWQAHLEGINGLGVIPARSDMMSYFACLDIDVYGEGHAATLAQIVRLQANLIPCLSKSGGLHVYSFYDGTILTSEVRHWLTHLADLLGFKRLEIFPKQDNSTVVSPGNWINMPYFGDQRPALSPLGNPLTADQFIELAQRLRMDKAGFAAARSRTAYTAPQCIRDRMRENTIGHGTLNDTAVAYASYLARQAVDLEEIPDLTAAFIDSWSPGCDLEDKRQAARNGASKEYMKCLNGTICAKRCYVKVEVAETSNSLPFVATQVTLTKYNTDPPTFFLDYPERARVTIDLGTLASSPKLKLHLMGAWGEIREMPKGAGWERALQDMLKRMETVEAPAVASESGSLMDHLETFCRSGQVPYSKEMFNASVWFDKGRHYFVLDAFLKYLDQRRVQRTMKNHQVSCLLHSKGACIEMVVINNLAVETFNVACYPGFELPMVETSLAEDVV